MEVVSAVRQDLIHRIGRERFDLWFTQAVRLDVTPEAMVVEAADQFLLDRLRKQFHQEIVTAARQTAGTQETVFRVNSALKGASPASGDQPLAASGAGLTKPLACTDGPSTLALRDASAGPRRRRFAQLGSFVVGSNNRVGFTAAVSVAERPGEVSPFFLYGPSGCGKTHLLEGIWSQVRSSPAGRRVLYLAAEQFTTLFLEALRGGGLPSFRRKCREVDVLVIDDVHFFAGKRATIIELQHTIDALLRQGRQMVLAADRPPVLLDSLGAEIVARCCGGLVCGIDHADYGTRLEIAQRKAAQLEVAIPIEVLELISRKLTGDARQIHGALHRLEATAVALERLVTLELAESTLRDMFQATQRVVRLNEIEQAVCDAFGVDGKALREGGKAKAISHPRMLAMWLARKYTRAAFAEISQYFGRRSHSTVISAEKKIDRWLSEDASVQLGQQSCRLRDAVERIELRLRTG
jgi:chromosomal replication initiator protein